MAGRPRKTGKRTKSGRLVKEKDNGTPRARTIRDWFTPGKRQELSTYPLGIMYANGDISDNQREAGCRYAWLFRHKVGGVSVSALDYERQRGKHHDTRSEGFLISLKEELDRCQQALDKLGLREILEEIAVYEDIPHWMLPKTPTMKCYDRGMATKRALRILAQEMGLERRA